MPLFQRLCASTDLDHYKRRQTLIARLRALRAINESVTAWTQAIESQWSVLDAEETDELERRVEWTAANTTVSASNTPSMKRFSAKARCGFDPLNQRPHWMQPLAVSAQASNLAWQMAQDSTLATDLTTSGGIAVSNLCLLLKESKEVASSTLNTPKTPFSWNSHSYNGVKERAALEERLGLNSAVDAALERSELPREHADDLQLFLCSVCNGSPGGSVDSGGSIDSAGSIDSTGSAGSVDASFRAVRLPSLPSLHSTHSTHSTHSIHALNGGFSRLTTLRSTKSRWP